MPSDSGHGRPRSCENKDGMWVKPAIDTFAAAAANADWEGSLPSMALVLVDQPGKQSWPITGASFILVQKEQADAARAKMMMTFFDWAYTNGADAATALDYVPIPANVSQDRPGTGLADDHRRRRPRLAVTVSPV